MSGHLGPVCIELADKTAADFHGLAVCLDRVIYFGGDVGAFDCGGFGLDTVDALVEVVEGGGEGSVGGGREVPNQMEGRAICVEGALPVAGQVGLGRADRVDGQSGDCKQ